MKLYSFFITFMLVGNYFCASSNNKLTETAYGKKNWPIFFLKENNSSQVGSNDDQCSSSELIKNNYTCMPNHIVAQLTSQVVRRRFGDGITVEPKRKSQIMPATVCRNYNQDLIDGSQTDKASFLMTRKGSQDFGLDDVCSTTPILEQVCNNDKDRVDDSVKLCSQSINYALQDASASIEGSVDSSISRRLNPDCCIGNIEDNIEVTDVEYQEYLKQKKIVDNADMNTVFSDREADAWEFVINVENRIKKHLKNTAIKKVKEHKTSQGLGRVTVEALRFLTEVKNDNSQSSDSSSDDLSEKSTPLKDE